MAERDPLMIKWASWCWGKPSYIGVPLLLGIFILSLIDGVYFVYWLIRNWGKEV